MKCTCCGSKMKQLFTSFYCSNCEGRNPVKGGGNTSLNIGVEWKFIGCATRIEYDARKIKIDYMDTMSVMDTIQVNELYIEGIHKVMNGNYTPGSLHLYEHSLVNNIFKIIEV